MIAVEVEYNQAGQENVPLEEMEDGVLLLSSLSWQRFEMTMELNYQREQLLLLVLPMVS
jgi:hypothetical protein